MSYFPMFIDLENKNVLVVGGGEVAARKVRALLPFGAYITVAAPSVCEELLASGAAEILLKPFSPVMLRHQNLVVAATNDEKVNRKVAQACREKKIPVNVVDHPEDCTFIFPSILRRGDITVGVSTGGASPTAATWLKDTISEVIPPYFPKLVNYLSTLRPVIKDRIADSKVRQTVFQKLFDFCMKEKRELSEEELELLIKEGLSSVSG